MTYHQDLICISDYQTNFTWYKGAVPVAPRDFSDEDHIPAARLVKIPRKMMFSIML